MLEEESDSDTEGESFSDEFLAYGIENTDSYSREQDWVVQVKNKLHSYQVQDRCRSTMQRDHRETL